MGLVLLQREHPVKPLLLGKQQKPKTTTKTILSYEIEVSVVVMYECLSIYKNTSVQSSKGEIKALNKRKKLANYKNIQRCCIRYIL